MNITMLGTGHAVVTECYNTCFIMEDHDKLFLVDGGGGNTLLHQIKKAGYRWQDIRQIFVTHKHIDHLLGIIWLIRMITQSMNKGNYEGEAYIYAHDEVIHLLRSMSCMLLKERQTRYIDQRLHLVELGDGEEFCAVGNRCIAFDIHSKKEKQFGFTMYFDGEKKITCCGDEPYNETEYFYAFNSDWLLHEAFCLFSQVNVFKPYEKHHATVKDACEIAEKLNIKNLLLYHTEDTNLYNRRELYITEGKEYFQGNIFIPRDLERISM